MNEETRKKIEEKAIEYGGDNPLAIQDFCFGALHGYSLSQEELATVREERDKLVEALKEVQPFLWHDFGAGGPDTEDLKKRIETLLKP